MGEISTKGERILGGYVENQVVLPADTCLSIKENLASLHNFDKDKLKYFQDKPVDHNKCKFSTTHEAALMVESKGARKNEF